LLQRALATIKQSLAYQLVKSRGAYTEFKPALRFVMIFVATYFVGNILYGIYVEINKPSADPMTVWVTKQVAMIISLSNNNAIAVRSGTEPIVELKRISGGETDTVLRVFEGCNGLNVMIVFAAFVIAFRGNTKPGMFFIAGGFLLLHLANLLRIILLYYTALNQPMFFYYFHKYFFTAVLYLVVFGLWVAWTRLNSSPRAVQA
jgi:exosortase family protein XrtF